MWDKNSLRWKDAATALRLNVSTKISVLYFFAYTADDDGSIYLVETSSFRNNGFYF